MSIATLTSKGQITIPKQIRQALGLAEGDRMLFVIEADRAVIVPLPKSCRLSELYGILPATRPYPGHDAIREQLGKELGERIQRGDE